MLLVIDNEPEVRVKLMRIDLIYVLQKMAIMIVGWFVRRMNQLIIS